MLYMNCVLALMWLCVFWPLPCGAMGWSVVSYFGISCYSLKLKIKHSDCLLALYFEFENELKFYKLRARSQPVITKKRNITILYV